MKFMALILGMTLSGASMAGGFCEGSRARSVAEQLANLELGVDLDLIDLDLFSGGAAVAGYEYEVEPAYTNGLYARTDRWKVGLDLVPQTSEDIIENLSGTAGLGTKSEMEATFVRFFDDACRAEVAKPYSPRRIPLKAKTAIGNKFEVGDYFIFKSKLGFVVSLDILKLLGNPLWGVGAHASYLMEGTYQVYIIRQDQDHVRLKVVARRGKDGALGLSLGWSGEFDVFGVSALDRQLRRQVNPKPLKVAYHDTKAQVFLIDYVLNLKDPTVAAAYDKIVRQIGAFDNIRLASPFADESKLESELILDLAPLEDLYKEDYANNNVKRVKRNLRSSSMQDGRSFGLELGNKILGFEFDATASTSRMSVRKPDDSIERYLLRSYDRTYDGHFAWSFARLYTKRTVEVLLKADEGFTDLDALNIVQTFERKDKRLKRKEFDEIQLSLKKALPSNLYDIIPFETWTQSRDQLLKNFGMRFQLVMGPEVVFDTPTMTADQVIVLYRDYILRKGFGARDFYTNQQQGRGTRTAEGQYETSLRQIGRKLSIASSNANSDVERLEAFIDLRSNTVFSQTGIGFLMTLQPNQIFRFDLNLSANGQRLDVARGDENIATFYRQLLTIKAALENDGLDLRREAESLSN